MSRLFHKRLNKELQMYQESSFKFPNLVLRPCEEDLHLWYFIVHGLKDTVYDGGVYYGTIHLPSEYPLKPPDFKFITPNGRFETNKKICTTFSGFHQDTYSSSWNIMTMMEGMISLMTDDRVEAQGIGSINVGDDKRRQLAAESVHWNKGNETFAKIFFDADDVLNE